MFWHGISCHFEAIRGVVTKAAVSCQSPQYHHHHQRVCNLYNYRRPSRLEGMKIAAHAAIVSLSKQRWKNNWNWPLGEETSVYFNCNFSDLRYTLIIHIPPIKIITWKKNKQNVWVSNTPQRKNPSQLSTKDTLLLTKLIPYYFFDTLDRAGRQRPNSRNFFYLTLTRDLWWLCNFWEYFYMYAYILFLCSYIHFTDTDSLVKPHGGPVVLMCFCR